MNKQEAIETIEAEWFSEVGTNLQDITDIINMIDEPQKVVIPKFVADWIDILGKHGLFGLNYDSVDTSIWDWVNENYDYNIIKLHLAYLYGYEIEQEKLYTVEIPNPNGLVVCLERLDRGKIALSTLGESELTESEIKEDFDWAWDAGFAKEVE